MLKGLLKDKQKAATIQLLQIGQQRNSIDFRWANTSFEHHTKRKKKNRNILVKTQNNSPKHKEQENIRQGLKVHLQQLKKGSIINIQHKTQEKQKQKAKLMPLRSMNLNLDSFKTVEQIYLNKQKSQLKMRPLVYIQSNFNRQYQNQQQKIRNLIKRKVVAKDLFRNKYNESQSTFKQNQNQLPRSFSQKPMSQPKKSLLFHNYKNFLPHIVLDFGKNV